MKIYLYLLGHSRELEDVEGLVVHGGALVDVDDHAGFPSATQEALQVVGQFALSEGNLLQQPEGGRDPLALEMSRSDHVIGDRSRSRDFQKMGIGRKKSGIGIFFIQYLYSFI